MMSLRLPLQQIAVKLFLLGDFELGIQGVHDCWILYEAFDEVLAYIDMVNS